MDKLKSSLSYMAKHIFAWFLVIIGSVFMATYMEHGTNFVWYQKLIFVVLIAIFITLSTDWLNKLRDKRDRSNRLYRDGYAAGLNDALDLMEKKLSGS